MCSFFFFFFLRSPSPPFKNKRQNKTEKAQLCYENFRGRTAATSPGHPPPPHLPAVPPACSLQSHSMKCYEIASWEGGKQKARRLFRKIRGSLSDVPKKLPSTPLLHFQGRGKSGLKIMSQNQRKQTRPWLVFSTDFSRHRISVRGGWGQADEAQ